MAGAAGGTGCKVGTFPRVVLSLLEVLRTSVWPWYHRLDLQTLGSQLVILLCPKISPITGAKWPQLVEVGEHEECTK